MIYSGSINDELSRTTTARIHQATNEITRVYDAKIAAAQKEIATVQRKEASLQRQVTNSKFLAECEAGEVRCSQTHKLGCGPYCKRDARRAAVAAAALTRARPQFDATIAADRRKIALWQSTETTQIANRVATIKADRDFLARQAALERVEKANPGVKKYVEFFLAFLIAIDLVALILKLTHLLSTGGAYERSAAALRANGPRRGAPLKARRRAHPPDHARGTGRGGRGRAQDPGRGQTEAGRAETVASCCSVERAHLIHSAGDRRRRRRRDPRTVARGVRR